MLTATLKAREAQMERGSMDDPALSVEESQRLLKIHYCEKSSSAVEIIKSQGVLFDEKFLKELAVTVENCIEAKQNDEERAFRKKVKECTDYISSLGPRKPFVSH